MGGRRKTTLLGDVDTAMPETKSRTGEPRFVVNHDIVVQKVALKASLSFGLVNGRIELVGIDLALRRPFPDFRVPWKTIWNQVRTGELTDHSAKDPAFKQWAYKQVTRP